ncbi:MAG: DNA topology modulation protein [Alphaproteobacteria bacterium]|nr:DNA topology modulation protein [Alphaproteobacteria bacterium]
MIFGLSGSGKSTFALLLSKLLQIQVYHLDKYFFTCNWVERDYAEFLEFQENFVNQDSWIIDGNNLKSLEMRWKRADLVIFFNYPLYICYFRVLKRFLFPDKAIDDRAEGCNETIKWSLLKYMWGYKDRIKEQINFLKDKYPNAYFIEIRNESDLKNLKTYFQNIN